MVDFVYFDLIFGTSDSGWFIRKKNDTYLEVEIWRWLLG